MIYNPMFGKRQDCIDRKEKHGKCRYDSNKPTGRFCDYWKKRIKDADCKKCKKCGKI